MGFTTPFYLLLLAALPLLGWLGWPSRGPSRRREIVSLAVRLLIALLLVLGLAGLEVRRASDDLSVVFLIDDSDSMGIPVEVPTADGPRITTPRELAAAYAARALEAMGPDDRAAIVVFGGDAVVERPLSASTAMAEFTSLVTTLQTDLAGAIRLGLALLPADTARRLVILSDGMETSGDALEAARLAAASGTQIVVVPFNVLGGAESLITEVSLPSRIRQGEQVGLAVTIESPRQQRAAVRILAGEAVVYERVVSLRRGANAFSLPITAGEPGFVAYRVQVLPESEADTFYQNNELAAFTQVEGPPRILLVTNPSPRDGVPGSDELLRALREAGLQVDDVLPAALPVELAALSEYSTVILVDVPARSLTPRQMNLLQTYVRDLGGGLVAVGGPTSFGVGGYYRTPLEDTLPVEMTIKDEKRRASLTMVFVIDKSGSMSEATGGVTKVDLAKEAVIRSIELLSPFDKIGVIAFDETAAWVVPITPLENADAVIAQIGTIRADGGTDIYAGVKAAAEQLPADDSSVKHVILLTDGGADPTGIPELVESMYLDDGITLSSVGVGQGAAPFLPQLAEVGGGVYHFTEDAGSLPAIFAEETTLATRAYIIEQEFFPGQSNPSPILTGIESVPRLLGYIGTTAKDAAQVILVNPDSPNPEQPDPILASWRYGLGRAVAWTSDATGRWAKDWVTWDQYARFWAQVVRSTISTAREASVDVTVSSRGEQASILVDARTDEGDFLNSLQVSASVVGPDGLTQLVTLVQVAPGRYAGNFDPTVEGAYLVRVAGAEPGQESAEQFAIAQTAGWVLSYSPEYQFTLPSDEDLANPAYVPPNMRRLLEIAARTGGSAIGISSIDSIFQHDLPAPARSAQPIWQWLLAAAVCLLPLDIAVRRLVFTRGDLRRVWGRAAAWVSLRAPQPAAPARSQQLSSLIKAKDRAGEAAQPTSRRAAPTSPAPASEPPDKPAPPAPPPPAPRPASPTSTSAALLAKKREREKKA